MIANSTAETRLCPHCANSIEPDATKCPYCKTDLLGEVFPQWLKRDESLEEPRLRSDKNRRSGVPSKFIWMAAMLVTASIAFFGGWYVQRSQLFLLSQAKLKELRAKDQMIQSQEAQLAQSRQQLNDNSNQLAEIKSRLEQSQKELSATQQRLTVATREVDRLKASRPVATARTPSRAPSTAASLPVPVARRTAEPGIYETTRTASVYENPSSTSRVVTQINRGTRINVVGSAGEWLEVRSKHGNPPGYVRADDARPIGKANSEISREAKG